MEHKKCLTAEEFNDAVDKQKDKIREGEEEPQSYQVASLQYLRCIELELTVIRNTLINMYAVRKKEEG